MHQAKETPARPRGRLGRARALYRNTSVRRTAWLLLKDTVQSCMEYRILGLAAEAAFFTLLSVPPLLLSMIGLLGYVDAWTGAHSIAGLENNILEASRTVLSDQGVKEIAQPLLDDVIKGGRPDVISLGFVFALWSGSRAVNVFIDTITVMYGLDGARGIVKTRLLAFLLFVVALLIGSVALPLMVAGPDAVEQVVPRSATFVSILYWPVVIVLSVVFLTTLYHVSVPVRSPWVEDVPGALVALAMWVLGSFLLRIYLTGTVEGPTIYGSLAAPVAVLLWIGVSAFAVLVGAAVNAALDRVWPSVAMTEARAAREKVRQEQTSEHRAWTAAHRALGGDGHENRDENGNGNHENADADGGGGAGERGRGAPGRGGEGDGVDGHGRSAPGEAGPGGGGPAPSAADGAKGRADEREAAVPAEYPERWTGRLRPVDNGAARLRRHARRGAARIPAVGSRRPRDVPGPAGDEHGGAPPDAGERPTA